MSLRAPFGGRVYDGFTAKEDQYRGDEVALSER